MLRRGSIVFSLILLPLLLLLRCGASSEPTPAAHRRSLLRNLAGDSHVQDVALDLNSSSFDAVLRQSKSPHAIVEFFAHWCPACRNYKPQYEKVARLFNGPDAVHPGLVLMARVDCADKINTNLCERFSVYHYPMLFWAPPAKLASGRWDPKQPTNDLQIIDGGKTAELLLNWINKKIGSSFSLEDERNENVGNLWNASDPEQITRAVFDVEEATAEAYDIVIRHKMLKLDARAPLLKFLQLLVAHHPSRRCRMGSAEILVNFYDLWPSDLSSVSSKEVVIPHENNQLQSFSICGKDAPHGYWKFCRGSKNDTRGFSCGLWILLHSLSVRVEDGESHFAFTSICDFIHNFFICEECRMHFYGMCSGVSVPFNTTRDLGLWLWRTHNKVNQRLMAVEKDLGTGDSKFPKVIWPSKQLCPACYSSSSKKSSTDEPHWDEDEVFNFLVKYYGKMLASSKYSDQGRKNSDALVSDEQTGPTHAVAVPVGAALAIALASCAFGALACFWRTQQKNRKYKHQQHSLKNV